MTVTSTETVAAKVTVLYVAVHLNLRPVITEPPTVRGAGGNGLYCIKLTIISLHFFELSFMRLREAYV